MGSLALAADERVERVRFKSDSLVVSLKDGREISVPLAWYPRLQHASTSQRKRFRLSAGGYGIHWPDINEDLSTEGLLRGAPSPEATRSASRRKRPSEAH